MFRILDKYIFKEVGQTWLAVTGVLLLILVGNQFARILGEAAAGNLPRDAVLGLLGLTSLNYLTILVPVALFLSVMLAMGRLYKDSEMAAIVACGVGPRVLYRPLLVFALIISGLLAALSLEVAPWAMRKINTLKAQAEEEAEIGVLAAGQFRSTGHGIVFYAQGVTADGRLKDVFLERRQGDRVEVVVAKLAEQKNDPERGIRLMVLYDGTRFEGIPGDPAFRTLKFKEHGIPITRSSDGEKEADLDSWTLREVYSDPSREAQAEFQWRLSAPISSLLLVLLALPLSRTTPRQGRYAKLTMAILVYILYSNLLGASRVWLARGTVPSFFGVWWVHLLVFGLALFLLSRNFGTASVYGRRRTGAST